MKRLIYINAADSKMETINAVDVKLVEKTDATGLWCIVTEHGGRYTATDAMWVASESDISVYDVGL